jgi:hypothetical protein
MNAEARKVEAASTDTDKFIAMEFLDGVALKVGLSSSPMSYYLDSPAC